MKHKDPFWDGFGLYWVRVIFNPKRTHDLKKGFKEIIGKEFLVQRFGTQTDTEPCPGQGMYQFLPEDCKKHNLEGHWGLEEDFEFLALEKEFRFSMEK